MPHSRGGMVAKRRTGPPRNCFLPFDHNPIVPPRTKPPNGTRNPDISAGKFMNGCFSMQRGRPAEECSAKRSPSCAAAKLMQFSPLPPTPPRHPTFKRRNAHALSGKQRCTVRQQPKRKSNCPAGKRNTRVNCIKRLFLRPTLEYRRQVVFSCRLQ